LAKEKNKVVLSQYKGDDISMDEVFERHDQALIEHAAVMPETKPFPVHSLSPELQRAVQALCDTYETLDLRIETTLANAANDFVTALSEVDGHEAELRKLVAQLIQSLHRTPETADSQQVILQLSYKNEDELMQQILSTLEVGEDAP
jgi:hypothetical protein